MCELMTIAASVAFTVAFFAAKRRGAPTGALFTTMLMFWGAALMWAVDCVANAMDGEGLMLTNTIAASWMVFGVDHVRSF